MTENLVEFTDANFENETQEGLVIVDFWAPWCGPCRMVGPIIEELASQYEGQVKVGKLNTDEHQMTAAQHRVMSIPTVIVFKDGEVVDTHIGFKPKNVYVQAINKHLAASA